MNKKSAKKRNALKNKRLVTIVAIAVVVVLVVVISVIIALNMNKPKKIDDDYFVSDGEKIVLSLDDEMTEYIDGEFEPSITHVVYYYSGDEINNVKIFFVYDDEAEAEAAYNGIGDVYINWATDKELDGKYVVFQADNELYEGLSAKRVREDVESIKAIEDAL